MPRRNTNVKLYRKTPKEPLHELGDRDQGVSWAESSDGNGLEAGDTGLGDEIEFLAVSDTMLPIMDRP